MSISTTVPKFEWLPTMFSQSFIVHVQRNVQLPQQLLDAFSSYQPQILLNKSLPIAKQQFFKRLIQRQPVKQALSFLYAYMTQHSYSVEQKFHVLNLIYKLIYLISEISMSKQNWKSILQKELNKLSLILQFSQCTNLNHQTQSISHSAILSIYEVQQLRIYIRKNITPFYQIWQKILDQNQWYVFNSQFYEPVDSKYVNSNLSQGKKLEVSEILALDFLKDFISEKPPIEQKKDPKKK